jgi:hypothetical protein
MIAQLVSGAAHLLAEPPFAVAALEGLLAGVLQEAAGREREAEQAGSESREPRVEGPGNAVTCLYPHIRGLTTPPAPPPPPQSKQKGGVQCWFSEGLSEQPSLLRAVLAHVCRDFCFLQQLAPHWLQAAAPEPKPTSRSRKSTSSVLGERARCPCGHRATKDERSRGCRL